MISGLFKKKNIPENTAIRPAPQVCDGDPAIIAEYFEEKTGISFKKQTGILKSKLISFCGARQIENFDILLKAIKENLQLEQDLIDYLTTNESYFYREFSAIKQIVDEIVLGGRKVNILCAPCSTGEEPYSIAIALLEQGVASSDFSILGVDISNNALVKAGQASFRERNVSKMPRRLVEKYFTQNDSKYELEESVKSCVSFRLFNILDPAITRLGKFDYVISRNMLIYFDAPTKKKASGILQSLLRNPADKVIYGHADLY